MSEKKQADKGQPSSAAGSAAQEAANTLGDYLRSGRLRHGLSFEDLSHSTGIRVLLLKALEENRRQELPAEVFVQGFIKILSKRLNLDAGIVSSLYSQGMPGRGIKTTDGINVRGIVNLQAPDSQPLFTGYRIYAWLISAILVVFAFYITYHFYQIRSASEPAAEAVLTTTIEESAEGALPAVAEGMPAPAEPAVAVESTEMSSAEQEQAAAGQKIIEPESILKMEINEAAVTAAGDADAVQEFNYVLKAQFKETTWLEVSVDKQGYREFNFHRGDRSAWKARQAIDLHIGNAGGVDLILNDRPLPKLGSPGETVRLSIPRDTQ